MTTIYTHHLTWITMGWVGAAITTPIADGLETHLHAVNEAVASYPTDEDDRPPALRISEPFVAVAYRELPDDKTTLDGSDDDLRHLGNEQFGETWYGQPANA